MCVLFENNMKTVEKMPPVLNFFSDNGKKVNDEEKKRKTESIFLPHYPNRPVSQNYKYTQMVGFAWWLHICILS